MDFGILEGVLDCLVFGVEAKSNNLVDLVDSEAVFSCWLSKKNYQAYMVQSPP